MVESGNTGGGRNTREGLLRDRRLGGIVQTFLAGLMVMF